MVVKPISCGQKHIKKNPPYALVAAMSALQTTPLETLYILTKDAPKHP